jgi:serine protease Do
LDFGLVSNFVLRISNFVARKNREQSLRFGLDSGLTDWKEDWMMRRFARWDGFVVWLSAALAPLAAAGRDDLGEQQQRAVKAAVAKIAPSVVRIETFGGAERVEDVAIGAGPTTGLVVSEDGFIVSSAFHFVQQPASILVTLPSGKRTAAKMVSRDSSRMLVLLRASSDERLAPAQAAPKEEMRVGQSAIAVGRTFETDQPNLSVGIVSALDRIWGKAIQTDAHVSPSNYGGPLIDLQGRVLGVLSPLSPEGRDEIAGAQWYDSGIGFAVPLVDVQRRLATMKQGVDLYPGLIGATLKGTDIYSGPAVIATVQAKSPAFQAGLKTGDRIVEANGAPIERIAQLKHAIGPLYAGDKARLSVLRGQERLEVTVQLTEKLEPYEHPFLGVLPIRSRGEGQRGVAVRYVFPKSGAAKAGIQANDRLISLGDRQLADANAARELIAAHAPAEKVIVQLQRKGVMHQVEVELASLPTSIPDSLPPARETASRRAGQRPKVGIVPLKIPEEPNDCTAYVPESYDPELQYGLVVWLHAPGELDQEKLLERWKSRCDRNDLILLAPKPADPSRWQPAETAFVSRVIDDVLSGYNVDRSRIVVCGNQAGGVMAYLAALAHRDVVRGVAVVDAPLPTRAQPPTNDPLQPLAVFSAAAGQSQLADRIRTGLERIRQMKHPVTVKSLGDKPRPLNDDELAELVRWIDMLDRI